MYKRTGGYLTVEGMLTLIISNGMNLFTNKALLGNTGYGIWY